ncbi:MAG: carcinine hydrolase/isopenicillin-N N-acyltransferase family protein [Planctomycetia bacterium]|nr:carcinine hydrolase/isopenicillin-N N-acyltransferase family protein [Planctomycetia bacterium]
MSDVPQSETSPPRPRRFWRIVRRTALALAVVLVVGVIVLGIAVKDHVRTMWSLQRVPNTKMYVLDYYGDYHLDEIAENGIDVDDPEGSLGRALLPDFLANWIVGSVKKDLPPIREPIRPPRHSCTTVAFRTRDGQELLGRNLDWMHDACVVLRIHARNGASSVAVLDPHYLGFDADRLDNPSLVDRFRLLFTPYIAMDGMNEHGVAIGEMSLEGTRAPFAPAKPSVINSLAIRLILDNARNTDEAVDIMRGYNLHFPATTCHYLIADAAGKTAAVEFLDGRVEVTGTEESWQVSTNDRLSGKSEAENDRACWRYRKASDRVAGLDGNLDVPGMLDVMASVSVKDWTMWTSVYNLTTGEYEIAYRRNFNDVFPGRLAMRSGAAAGSRGAAGP